MACSMAVVLFVFILLAANVLSDLAGLLASGRLSFGIFSQLILLLIPFVAAYALPLGMLSGIMIAFGRLTSSQELTAMRSSGLSLYYLAAPVFFLAGLGVILSLAFNYYYTPVTRTQYKALKAKVVQNNPLTFLQPKTFIKDFPGFVLYASERDGTSLKDFWIWELDDENRVRMFVRAEEGRLEYLEAEAAMVLRLLNGTGERRDPEDPENLSDPSNPTLFFRELPIRLSLEKILGRSTPRIKLSQMNINQLMGEWNRLRTIPDPDPQQQTQLLRTKIQIQSNTAMGMAVLSLSLVALPLAIQVGRKETYANFVLALILALTYYFMMIIVSWLEGKPHLRPDLLVWIPNLIFQSMGLFMLSRANDHR